jgi:hypothetical protein
VEIRLARTRYDLSAAFVLIVYAAIFTALVWLVTSVLTLGDTALTVALVVLVALWLFWSGTYLFAWTRRRRVDVPLSLRATGLVARGQFGDLEVPWAAVRSAEVERTWTGRLLRIRLVPATDPARAQVVDHLDDAMLGVVEKHGIRYSLRVLDIGLDPLRDAFTVQSAGRVRVG